MLEISVRSHGESMNTTAWRWFAFVAVVVMAPGRLYSSGGHFVDA